MNAENIRSLAKRLELNVNVVVGEQIPNGNNIVFAFTDNPLLGHWTSIEKNDSF